MPESGKPVRAHGTVGGIPNPMPIFSILRRNSSPGNSTDRMDTLVKYIKANQATPGMIWGKITDERGQKVPQRFAFVRLRKFARDYFDHGAPSRMIVLSGLRGVGKTTLAWQTARYVYDNKTRRIFFISGDVLSRLGHSLFDVFEALEQVLGTPLNRLKEKIMLIIDEIHEVAHWQKDLKILYDTSDKFFIVATGSSALLLRSSADLVARWVPERIFPFRFAEFILAKSWLLTPDNQLFPPKTGKPLKEAFFFAPDYKHAKKILQQIEQPLVTYFERAQSLLSKNHKKNTTVLIDEYISYHNIARLLPIENKSLIIDKTLELFDRILTKDLADTDESQRYVFSRLLMMLAAGDEINYHSLANHFRITESQVEMLTTKLHDAEILNIFLPHGGTRTKTGGNKKAFFLSPSLRHALLATVYGEHLSSQMRAKLYEDIVAMYLRIKLNRGVVSYGFGKGKNPDFVIETMDKPVLLEVGSGKKTASQIFHYGDYRYGLVVSPKFDRLSWRDDSRILFVPLKFFLLL